MIITATYKHPLRNHTPILIRIPKQHWVLANRHPIIIQRNATQHMSRSLNTSVANASVVVLAYVQTPPRGDALFLGEFGQVDGGVLVEQGHEGRARAAQDVGVEFVAARRGDDYEDVAVDEVREVVLDDGRLGGGRRLYGGGHAVVFGVELVVLATRHCGGGSD